MLKFQFYVYRMKACLMLIIFYKTTMLKKSTFLELRGFEGVQVKQNIFRNISSLIYKAHLKRDDNIENTSTSII